MKTQIYNRPPLLEGLTLVAGAALACILFNYLQVQTRIATAEHLINVTDRMHTTIELSSILNDVRENGTPRAAATIETIISGNVLQLDAELSRNDESTSKFIVNGLGFVADLAADRLASDAEDKVQTDEAHQILSRMAGSSPLSRAR